MHTGEKPYKCTELGCEKAFKYTRQIKIHKERLHGIKMDAVQEKVLIMNEEAKVEAITNKDVVCGKEGCFEEMVLIKQEAVFDEEEEIFIKEDVLKEESVIMDETAGVSILRYFVRKLFLADFIKKPGPFYKKHNFDTLYRPKNQKVRKCS